MEACPEYTSQAPYSTKNDTDTPVASPKEYLMLNEPTCDEDMICENNTDNNIDLDNDNDDRFTDCLSNFSEKEDFFQWHT